MRSVFGLAVALAAFWMANSGYLKPMLLGFGVVSIVIVIAIVKRMEAHDGERFPLFVPSLRLPGYLVWMIGQIIASNIDVARRVWLGRKSLSPTILTVRAEAKSDVGKVLYANSITMTPGTVTLFVHDDTFEVHALTEAGAEELERGVMGRKVAALEQG